MNRWRRAACLCATAVLAAACGDDDETTPPPGGSGCVADGSGRLQMTLSGDYAETFEWANTGTGCGGVMTAMGFDLSWSREEGAGGYSVLMSIRGLMPGQTGAATGDMTIGGSALVGTIYSHANDGVCAFDITENSVLQDSSIGRSYKMVGSGSCTEPLDAFPGAGNLTVADGFSFTGVYGVIDAP